MVLRMKLKRPFAPILHTGFANNYEKDEVERFVAWADKAGYGGISVEGKTDAPVPKKKIGEWIDGYMRGLSYAADALEARGMSLWIFDEWGYPTGTAAGLSMKNHPEYRSKKLHLAIDVTLSLGESVSFTAPAHLLSAAAWHTSANVFAGPVGGYENIPVCDGKLTYTAIHERCRFAAVTWEYDTTRTVGVFEKDAEDDTLCTLDLLSHEAVASLISVMHEEYYRRLGKHFGGAIRGFFYDEPFLSFPYPYTFDLIDEFFEKKGYDPTPNLPRLLALGDGRLAADWRDVATTRMSQAFLRRIGEWCHAHGVELTGHQDLDHDVRSTATVSGDFFKNSRYNDSPGVDYIWAQIRPGIAADYPRFAGSFSRMTGKAHATSESFAATGRCMTPDYMRWAMEHQAIRGIDRFYLMIADPKMERNIYASPIDPTHSLAKNYAAEVNRHVETVNALLKGATPVGDTALYIPRREISAEYPPARPNRVSLHMPWEWVNDTARALIKSHVDFDYIWDDIIAEGEIDGRGELILPDGSAVKTIIIPAVRMLGEKVREKLEIMRSRGANIVFVGYASDGFVGAPTATYPEDIGKFVTPAILAKEALLSVTVRENGEGDRLYFILNEENKQFTSQARLSGGELRQLSSYDFDTGEWISVKTEGGEFTLSLCPLEMKIIRSSDKKSAAKAPEMTEICARLFNFTVTTPNGVTEMTGDEAKYIEGADFAGITVYTAKASVPVSGVYRMTFERLAYAATVTIATVSGSETTTKKAAFAPYHADFEMSEGEYDVKIEVLNADAAAFLGTAGREEASRQNGSFKDIFENDRDFVDAGVSGVSMTLLK